MLVRYGQLGTGHKNSKCTDCPSPNQPAEVECPGCEGQGCEACGDDGHFTLTACPFDMLDNDLWEIRRFSELFDEGCPPVSGGTLDQSAWFLDANRVFRHEDARVKHYLSERK